MAERTIAIKAFKIPILWHIPKSKPADFFVLLALTLSHLACLFLTFLHLPFVSFCFIDGETTVKDIAGWCHTVKLLHARLVSSMVI